MEIVYVNIYNLVHALWTYSDDKYLDYITWWMYILSHFGRILLCNSNIDADDG